MDAATQTRATLLYVQSTPEYRLYREFLDKFKQREPILRDNYFGLKTGSVPTSEDIERFNTEPGKNELMARGFTLDNESLESRIVDGKHVDIAVEVFPASGYSRLKVYGDQKLPRNYLPNPVKEEAREFGRLFSVRFKPVKQSKSQ
jgi:hypothetical protein